MPYPYLDHTPATDTPQQKKACPTTSESGEAGRGITKEPLKAKQTGKGNKNGKKHVKRIRGKPY
jgi:hypothetical protein